MTIQSFFIVQLIFRNKTQKRLSDCCKEIIKKSEYISFQTQTLPKNVSGGTFIKSEIKYFLTGKGGFFEF